MAFVRTFLVNIIPNEITIEQFRDSMEYLGSICRIDKTPYLSDDQTTIGWNAFVYYESWKSCEATTIIDEHLVNPKRRNVLCFIEPADKASAGSVDVEIVTPTIVVYPLRSVNTKTLPVNSKFWLLCRNTSSHQYSYIPFYNPDLAHKLIRFIPKNYMLEFSVPSKTDGTQWEDSCIVNKIQLLNIGEILYIERTKVLYDAPKYQHRTKVYVQFKKWYVSEFTFKLQQLIAKFGKAAVDIDLGEPKWEISHSNYFKYEISSDTESWIRPNQHLYFDE